MTPEQFKKVIAPICSTATEKRCRDYSNELGKIRKNVAEDSPDYPIILLFQQIFDYHLRPDSPSQAFGPMFVMDGKRSAIPTDLTDEQRQFLADVLPSVEDAEMRARIADTLWELKFGRATDYAIEAIKAYLNAAEESNIEGWRFEADHFARALRIYMTMRRADKDGLVGIVVTDEIIKAVKKSAKTTQHYLTLKLIGLMHANRMPEANDFISTSIEVAEKLEAEGNLNGAHDAWVLVGDIQNSGGFRDEAIEAKKRAAETYVKLADLAEAGERPSYMQICSWLQSAVESYRVIKGGKDRAEKLYVRLTASQPRIRDEMQQHFYEMDIEEPVKKAIEHVSNRKTTLGALMAFAFYRHPTSMVELRKHASNADKAGPIAAMFACTYHNKMGHVVARKGINETEESKLHRTASEIRKMQPVLFIVPAMQQIRFEHSVSLQDWFGFLDSHPFVPESHRMIFAEGLFHGFHGDYVAACHILMPQVESSIRHLLKEAGEETSKLNIEGLQEEKTLSQLLVMPKLEQILGEAVVFDLRGLLDEKDGDNFRHLLLHGLNDDGDLSGALPLYFYWLMVHLIFLPLNREGLDLSKKQDC